jgi:MFS family permease
MNYSKENWLAFILCAISYMFAGTVSTLMANYLPVALPDLLHEKISEARLGEIGAYINAISLYGWMVGGLLFGFLGDKIGRKKILVFSTILYASCTLMVVLVPNWHLLTVLRFGSGMGTGGVLLITTVYISEIWPQKTRAIMVGLLAIAFPIGIVATGGLTVLFSHWRDAFWLGLIPLFTALAIWLFLPESYKWQAQSENQVKNSIFEAQYRKNLIAGSLIFGAVLIGLWGIFSWLPSWIQTLLPKNETGQNQRGVAMMLLGMGGIGGGFLSGFLLKALGNKITLIITFSGLTLACSLIFLTNNSFSNIIYIEIATLSLFFGISQGALSSYIPELFPTKIRATGAGFCFNIGRFFTATIVFFVGNLVSYFGGFSNALLSFSIMFILALVLVIILPTKTQTE